jgi:hypothetical protein
MGTGRCSDAKRKLITTLFCFLRSHPRAGHPPK